MSDAVQWRTSASQAGALAAVLGLAATLAATPLQLPLICPLRALTGVPCPFCGMTTGTVALVRGDPAGAWAANPLALGFAPLAAAALAGRLRVLARGSVGRPWPAWTRPAAAVGLVLALAGAWVFELFRFGFF